MSRKKKNKLLESSGIEWNHTHTRPPITKDSNSNSSSVYPVSFFFLCCSSAFILLGRGRLIFMFARHVSLFITISPCTPNYLKSPLITSNKSFSGLSLIRLLSTFISFVLFTIPSSLHLPDMPISLFDRVLPTLSTTPRLKMLRIDLWNHFGYFLLNLIHVNLLTPEPVHHKPRSPCRRISCRSRLFRRG